MGGRGMGRQHGPGGPMGGRGMGRQQGPGQGQGPMGMGPPPRPMKPIYEAYSKFIGEEGNKMDMKTFKKVCFYLKIRPKRYVKLGIIPKPKHAHGGRHAHAHPHAHPHHSRGGKKTSKKDGWSWSSWGRNKSKSYW